MNAILQTLHRQIALLSHASRHPHHQYTVAAHQMRHGIVYQTARTDLLDLEGRGLLEKQRIGKTFYFTPAHDLDSALERLEPPPKLPGYVKYDSEAAQSDSSEDSADAP